MVVPSQPKSKGVSAVSTSTNTIISTISRANSTIASVKTDSNGCVICAAVAECPDCENNEYCITISLRCSSCLLHILCPQEEQQIKRFLINIASMNGTQAMILIVLLKILYHIIQLFIRFRVL